MSSAIPTAAAAAVRPLLRLLLATVVLTVAGCRSLPQSDADTSANVVESARPAATVGPIYEMTRSALAQAGAGDAALIVPDAQSAMEWRLALIDSAQSAIDMQYFVWAGDAAGTLILERLLLAADRGVRVRLLMDDLYLLANSGLDGPDEVLAAIDSHPNIGFRVFNAGRYRSGKLGIAGNFAGGFNAFNRRMHNKLMIADGRVAMVGGRNLADEYYGTGSLYNFVDLDAVVMGAVLVTVSDAFDRYWNSTRALPASALNPDAGGQELAQVREEVAEFLADQEKTLSTYPAEPVDWSAFFAAVPAGVHGGSGTFLQDDPEEDDDNSYRLYDMLAEFESPDDRHVYMITPYLIPQKGGLAELREMVASGLRVTLLTASLSSGDLEAANAHYKRYRKGILEAGAELYEFHHQPSAALRAMADVAPNQAEYVAFHPKTSITDGRLCFVGSLNLDPRAVVINTENGLVFESESFCGAIEALAELYIRPENSWKVTLDERGELQWTSYEGTVRQQPARSGGQRMADFFFSVLPIEDLL